MLSKRRCNAGRRNPWQCALWAGIIALIALPSVAMRFTNEVQWTLFDFAAATMLLGGVGLAIEIAGRTIERPAIRIGAIMLAMGVGALIWAEGAVGVF